MLSDDAFARMNIMRINARTDIMAPPMISPIPAPWYGFTSCEIV